MPSLCQDRKMKDTSQGEKKKSETIPGKQSQISKLKSRGKSIRHLDRGTAHSNICTQAKTLEAWPILQIESNYAWSTEVVRDEGGEETWGS